MTQEHGKVDPPGQGDGSDGSKRKKVKNKKDKKDKSIGSLTLVETASEEQEQRQEQAVYTASQRSEVNGEAESDIPTGGLPEDIYSLLFTSINWGPAFFYSLAVSYVQIGLILLILVDLLDVDSDNNNNPLQLPPGVPIGVTIAQAVSMILTVFTQTNLLVAIHRFSMDFDTKAVHNIHPSATFGTFILSIVLQGLAGTSMLVVSFILNMQSETVLSLMLNFAALAFVSEIQSVAFWVARKGYISNRIQQEAQVVTELKFPVPPENTRKFSLLSRRFLFVGFTAGLIALYGLLVQQQKSGQFLCDKIFVQFGDAFRPDLAYFSGIYQQGDRLISDRVVYFDEKGTGARFAYCAKEKAWTFVALVDYNTVVPSDPSVPSIQPVAQRNTDPCIYWMKSQETKTYDILETLSTPWVVLDYTTGKNVPADFFAMFCNDCGSSTTGCRDHGTCVDNGCVCDPGYIGLSCEHPIPCRSLELDARTRPFPYTEGGKFQPSTSYVMLIYDSGGPVLVYNKPVFVSRDPWRSYIHLILFTGRRWVVALNTEFTDAPSTSLDGLREYLPTDFHSWFSQFQIYFESDAQDVSTPSDYVTPVDLQWYKARQWIRVYGKSFFAVDLNQPTNTVLLCPSCRSIFNDCHNGGFCESFSGTCECEFGFTGALCEQELPCFDEDLSCVNGANCTGAGLCQNGGNCTVTGVCSCTEFFAGKLCQYNITEPYVD